MRSRLRAVQPAARRLLRAGRALLRPSVLTLWRDGRRLRAAADPGPGGGLVERALYELWTARYDRLSDADRRTLDERRERLGLATRFSLLIETAVADPGHLRGTLLSVARQTYPHWEVLVAPPADGTSLETLLAELALPPGRLRVLPGPPRLVPPGGPPGGGEFFARLAAGARLAEHALHVAAETIRAHPDTDLLFADDDELDAAGRRLRPRFKPDWNADLFASDDYLGPFVLYRRGALDGIDAAPDAGETELRVAVTAALKPRNIRHLPEVLCHRAAGDGSETIDAEARGRALARTHPGAESAAGLQPGTFRLRWRLPAPAPRASLLIPTRNALELLQDCLASVVAMTRYPDYEIVVIDNGSDDPECLAYLDRQQQLGRLTLLRSAGPFNFSALNNMAARQSRGEVLCFLNNDVAALAPGWLTELVSQALRPEVGAAGAKLLYPDGRVQHGGVLLGAGAPSDAVAGHLFHRLPTGHPGPGGRALLVQEVSAVTAACLAIRRRVFEQVGGFDERNLPVAFNDVDLCLRLRQAGYRIVWTPFAELRHHESASRGDDAGDRRAGFTAEVRYMRERWGELLDADPFYNPNLDAARADFSLAFPPRHRRPWRRPVGSDAAPAGGGG